MQTVLIGVVALAVGVGVGFVVRKMMAVSNAQSVEARAQKLLLEAEREADSTAKRTLQEAKDEIVAMRREVEEDVRARREELARLERRMTDAEEDLRAKTARVETRGEELDEREEKLTYVREQLEKATDLHRAQLVDEDRRRVELAEGPGQLPHRLGHQSGLQSDVGVSHLALDLGARHQGGDRIDHHQIE
jgi:myosin heavy subunit